jgi:hypothetical protein
MNYRLRPRSSSLIFFLITVTDIGAQSRVAPVTINPELSISPNSADRGQMFTQSGRGFTPSSTATIHYRKPDGSEYPAVNQPTLLRPCESSAP